MRIITEKALKEFGDKHPDIRPSLIRFIRVVRSATWQNIEQLREDFPHADLAKVESGRTVTVFNVAGNKCRVVAALHYNHANIYILGVFTHAEYSREQWKERL